MWNIYEPTVNALIISRYFLSPLKDLTLNFLVVVARIVIPVKTTIFVQAIYCQVDEFCIAILSKFALMLQRNATVSIYLVPFSFTSDLNGAKIFFSFISRFSRYDPATPVSIPSSPTKFGNSPNIMGLERSRNTGAKLCMGMTVEISPFDIARIYKIFAATFIRLDPKSPTKNKVLNFRSIKKSIGVNTITGKKLFAHDIRIESKSFEAFLMKTLLIPSEIGFRDANNIHTVEAVDS